MGEYTPGLPVDLESINEVAATATQGGDKAEQALGDMQKGFQEAGRYPHFAQGTAEGRANGRGLRAIAEAIPAV